VKEEILKLATSFPKRKQRIFENKAKDGSENQLNGTVLARE
jgi:hypothetical protein